MLCTFLLPTVQRDIALVRKNIIFDIIIEQK